MTVRHRRTPRLPAEVRREQLLDAALDVINREGFDGLSVEAVARRAGVTRPMIYDLFGDLHGLLVALIDREEERALAPLLEIVGGDPGDVDPEAFLIDGVRGFLRAVRADPKTWRLVLMPPRGKSPELRERIAGTRLLIADRVRELLDWGVAKRGGPPDLDHALAARVIVAAGEDAARLMLLHPTRFSPERQAAFVREALALVPANAHPRGNDPPPEYELPPPAADPPSGAVAHRGRMPRAERREHLLDVTLELLANEGFEALSVEAIARRAGVNRAIVYRSFANLQLLLVALLRREDARTRDLLDTVIPDDPAGRTTSELLAGALATFLSAVLRHPQTYRLVLQRPESTPLFLQKIVNRRRGDLADRLRPLVEWGLEGVGARALAIDAEILARMLLSIAEELARLALDDPDFPPERVLASAWTLLDTVPTR